VTSPHTIEGLLRDAAPQALGAVVRRFGNFADAEDAMQEALLEAATQWPGRGTPDNPVGWLIRVASRRMTDRLRSEEARRRREETAVAREVAPPEPAPAGDDTLALIFICCHPSLTPASAIPLTLRAVGGLTTAQIAAAFLVPEATMAQRISRAKRTIEDSGVAFGPPADGERAERLRSALHVLYLIFNEGYATSAGPELARAELSGEAIRLTRAVHRAVPDDPEVAGLLALMLLTDARRPARTDARGWLVPLDEQDRTLWDRGLIDEGLRLIDAAWRRAAVGEYQVQAAIAAVHDQAERSEDTDWHEIVALYGLLERIAPNPMIALNRTVAVAMVDGPAAGLALLEPLAEQLDGHHRLHAVRAHLLEMAGDAPGARREYETAAARTRSVRERDYLTARAARVNAGA
jgi:RNA polymerase sigma factor (sigma-70 family)